MSKKRKQLCWFFTNQQLITMTIIFLLGIAFQVANMVVNLNFLAVQKEVQNGNNDVWRIFLLLLLALSVFSVLQVLYMTFFS